MTRLRSVPTDSLHLWLMLVLTFTTGINDAVGYLGLDKVFTGNMTGNVVILGMALTGADDLPVLGPTLALIGFMAGAALAGRVLRGVSVAWGARTTWLLTLVAGVLSALGVVLLVVGDHAATGLIVTVTTLAALAMGTQAAVARHIAVKDVTTVVVTSTITGLAADSRLGGHRRSGSGRRVAAIVLIGLGATAGAAMLMLHIGAGLLLAGVMIAAVTAIGALHASGTAHTSDPAAAAA